MKPIVSLIISAAFVCAPLALVSAQSPSPTPAEKPKAAAETSPAARTDLYHVHFAKAAPGKAAAMAENLKKPDPEAPMPGHTLVLRHQDGDAWDYVMIEHLGTKASIEAARPAVPPEERNLGDWHNDTYVNGPSWTEFTKEMGIDEQSKTKSAGSVYVVSTYRAVAGERDALEKFLSETPPGAGVVQSGNVLLQHLEGADWNFVGISRFNSWQDYAKDASDGIAKLGKDEGGWFKIRELVARHTDTLTDRIAP